MFSSVRLPSAHANSIDSNGSHMAWGMGVANAILIKVNQIRFALTSRYPEYIWFAKFRGGENHEKTYLYEGGAWFQHCSMLCWPVAQPWTFRANFRAVECDGRRNRV